jgi:hypothetical protein
VFTFKTHSEDNVSDDFRPNLFEDGSDRLYLPNSIMSLVLSAGGSEVGHLNCFDVGLLDRNVEANLVRVNHLKF